MESVLLTERIKLCEHKICLRSSGRTLPGIESRAGFWGRILRSIKTQQVNKKKKRKIKLNKCNPSSLTKNCYLSSQTFSRKHTGANSIIITGLTIKDKRSSVKLTRAVCQFRSWRSRRGSAMVFTEVKDMRCVTAFCVYTLTLIAVNKKEQREIIRNSNFISYASILIEHVMCETLLQKSIKK